MSELSAQKREPAGRACRLKNRAKLLHTPAHIYVLLTDSAGLSLKTFRIPQKTYEAVRGRRVPCSGLDQRCAAFWTFIMKKSITEKLLLSE